MNVDRLTKLLQYLENDPDDAFTNYAVATEYLSKTPQKAYPFFEKLLTNHPEYLPTYYHAAQLFADLDEIEKADETYQKGIALAIKLEEDKTLRELKNAYQNFQFEQF